MRVYEIETPYLDEPPEPPHVSRADASLDHPADQRSDRYAHLFERPHERARNGTGYRNIVPLPAERDRQARDVALCPQLRRSR